jgi:hypothetical protein
VSEAARSRSTTVDIAIALTAAAAFAHAVTAPSHYDWWPASGVFFVVVAVAQAVLALALLRPAVSSRVVMVGVWATVGLIVLYVYSRTIGIWFAPGVPAHGASPQPGQALIPDGDKHVGPLDLFTLIVQVALVVILLGLLPERQRARTANRLLYAGASIWGLAALGVLS